MDSLTMGAGVTGTIILALDIYAIYSVMTSSASALAKILWTILILALPLVGLLIWFLAGPKGGQVRV